MAEAAGLDPHEWTSRELRRSFVSLLQRHGIADVFKSERLGHKEAGMRGVYGHVSPVMREEPKDALQGRWKDSLRERASLALRSSVRLLDMLLARSRDSW